MPSTKASVSYKKKDGHLTVSQDTRFLFWTPTTPPGASPSVTIPVADITNLQQTPATTPKVALKVFIKEDSYVFSFTSKDAARKEQENITDTLRNAIAANKVGTVQQVLPSATPTSTTQQDGGSDAQSAAMAMAKAASSNKAAEDAWYDDSKLKSDFQLQRSLLESNKTLNERFTQSLKEKPETVSIAQFTAQFWSTRLHMLRSHAIEKAQKQGEYNVLPEIKYTVKHGENGQPDVRTLNINRDQIKRLFKQYPVLYEAFNENCPPLDPGTFWQRFFSSRLLKKLKGERISRDDPPDNLLDKYLERKENGPASLAPIPRFIDLEGNEQNHSQRKGNRPDAEMRESAFDQPILHVLNGLSEKMLSHVAPEDGEAHGPIGMDEETFQQLQLRDLALTDTDNRLTLNVREQQRYVSGQGDALSADARRYEKQDPAKVLASLSRELHPSKLGSDEKGTLRLDRAIGFLADEDESDSDNEASTNGDSTSRKAPRVGSHAAMQRASTNVFASISRRRDAFSSDPQSLQGLSQATFDALTITHNTTTEFLHYFWTLFLSGDASRVEELAQLVKTLDRSLDRIGVVADRAEKERTDALEKIRKSHREFQERTGKRRKLDESTIQGGKKAVDQIVGPTVRGLERAVAEYRRAYEEQVVPGVAG
nr:putative rna polymerase ii transcription factor b subunit 1 [Quercus suber]